MITQGGYSAGGIYIDFKNKADTTDVSTLGLNDAFNLFPLCYDQAKIHNGAYECQAVTEASPTPGPLLIGHSTIAIETGLSDNFELATRWENADADSWSGFSQISPAAFVDLANVDGTKIGAKFVYDSAFLQPPIYAQNVFRSSSLATSFTSNYTALPDDAGGKVWAEQWHEAREYWWVLRVRNGSMKGYVNGVDVLPRAVDVPAYCEGRTIHGLDIVSIRAKPGHDFGSGIVVPADDNSTARLTEFYCKPFNGTL